MATEVSINARMDNLQNALSALKSAERQIRRLDKMRNGELDIVRIILHNTAAN